MKMTFEKWEDGRWFAVLPEYDGDQEDLEMIDGADKLLDFLTTDALYVNIDFSTNEHESWSKLILEAHDEIGGTYSVHGIKGFEQDIWLCNVTHVIFGEHPEVIFFKCFD